VQRGRGRAPFEGGLLNFQGHSYGPFARGREKARGRRRRRKGAERGKEQGKERTGRLRPDTKLTAKLSKDARDSKTEQPTDRSVDQFVSSGPPLGPPARAIDEQRRVAVAARRPSQMCAAHESPTHIRCETSFRGPGKGSDSLRRGPPRQLGAANANASARRADSEIVRVARKCRRDSLSAVLILDSSRKNCARLRKNANAKE